MLERYAYVLLNIEKYWNRLCDQNRAGKNVHAFVRRGLVGPKKAKLLLFYVTYPHKEIRGVCDFIERITGDADDLWNTYGHESLLESYEEYMVSCREGQKRRSLGSKIYVYSPRPVQPALYLKLRG